MTPQRVTPFVKCGTDGLYSMTVITHLCVSHPLCEFTLDSFRELNTEKPKTTMIRTNFFIVSPSDLEN